MVILSVHPSHPLTVTQKVSKDTMSPSMSHYWDMSLCHSGSHFFGTETNSVPLALFNNLPRRAFDACLIVGGGS